MMNSKKRGRVKSLTAGRPPTARKPKSISRKATKTLINALHLLEKKKAQAIARGDQVAQTTIDSEIAALGGIEKYQQASLQGQRIDRGGDSSRVLMEWLKSTGFNLLPSKGSGLRMLEVGALSTTNECSSCGFFNVESIQLNSQSDGIIQQHLIKRPLPKYDSERFDIISLSLVLNFVPDSVGRGAMLLRTLDFLKQSIDHYSSELRGLFPSLFMVLPAPVSMTSESSSPTKLLLNSHFS